MAKPALIDKSDLLYLINLILWSFIFYHGVICPHKQLMVIMNYYCSHIIINPRKLLQNNTIKLPILITLFYRDLKTQEIDIYYVLFEMELHYKKI